MESRGSDGNSKEGHKGLSIDINIHANLRGESEGKEKSVTLSRMIERLKTDSCALAYLQRRKRGLKSKLRWKDLRNRSSGLSLTPVRDGGDSGEQLCD
jgi:hypothetical protein